IHGSRSATRLLLAADQSKTSDRSVTAMPETHLKVLLVEDNKADATLLCRELRQAGFHLDSTQVETEADYCAQLALAPDIILSDYHLPQFSAMRALEILGERGLDIP